MTWLRRVGNWLRKQYRRTVEVTVDIKDDVIKKSSKILKIEQKISGTFMIDEKELSTSVSKNHIIASISHPDKEHFVELYSYNDLFLSGRVLVIGRIKSKDLDRAIPILHAFTNRNYQFEIKKSKNRVTIGSWTIKIDNTYLDIEFPEKTLWYKKEITDNKQVNVFNL